MNFLINSPEPSKFSSVHSLETQGYRVGLKTHKHTALAGMKPKGQLQPLPRLGFEVLSPQKCSRAHLSLPGEAIPERTGEIPSLPFQVTQPKAELAAFPPQL